MPTLLCCKPCLLYKSSQDIKARLSQKDEFSGVQLITNEKAKKSDDEEELLDKSGSPIAQHERSPPGDAINFSGDTH